MFLGKGIKNLNKKYNYIKFRGISFNSKKCKNNDIFFVIPVVIIISREFLVIAIRQRLAEAGGQIKLKVILISKFKTAIQLFALLMLIYKYHFLALIYIFSVFIFYR